MFNKLLLILILVVLYHNLSFNDKQNVKDLASDTIYNLGVFAQELKEQHNSTMATDETYCPVPDNAPNYPRQIIYYDTQQDNQFVEYSDIIIRNANL